MVNTKATISPRVAKHKILGCKIVTMREEQNAKLFFSQYCSCPSAPDITENMLSFWYFHIEPIPVMSLQVCYHMGSKTDPDQRDLQKDKSDIEILQHYIARCFPGLVPEPAIVESCLYTVQC